MMSKVILPESMEGKTILVAGAAGFVPSTLCEFYLNLGAHVIGLDNFITGSQSNIDLISKYKNFEFHQCNIYERLPQFKDQKIDEFITSLEFISNVNVVKTKVNTFEITKYHEN